MANQPLLDSPETPTTLAGNAFERLRTAITTGEIAPGSKLSEPRISLQYGISRGPLREAIRRLEGCKLVQIKPNAGARVVSLNTVQAIEIYEIREALEGLACGLAADRIGPGEGRQLRELLAQHERQIDSEEGRRYYQKEGDLDFHYLIVQLSGNTRLFKLLCGELYYLLRLYRSQTSAVPARPEQACKEHYQIVDAIEAGDRQLAELLMQRHIAQARSALVDRLNAGESWDVAESAPVTGPTRKRGPQGPNCEEQHIL